MSHVSEQSNPAGAIPVWIANQPSTATSTYTNISGTITAGATAQVLQAANAARRGFWIQNLSSGDLWINDLGNDATAASPCLRIPANGYYESPFNGASPLALSIIGATTGQSWSGRAW